MCVICWCGWGGLGGRCAQLAVRVCMCVPTTPRCMYAPRPTISTPTHQVIATGRRGERLSALQRELGGPSKVHTVQADVADIEAMRAALGDEALPPAFRAVDVLVRVCVFGVMVVGGGSRDVNRPAALAAGWSVVI